MASLEQLFGFEQSMVPFDNGSFEPLLDAAGRWCREYQPRPGGPGRSFHLLYELQDGRFAAFDYCRCAPQFRDAREVLVGTRGSVTIIEPSSAVALLIAWEEPIPTHLKKWVSAPPAPTTIEPNTGVIQPRPLEHWAGKLNRDEIHAVAAHQLDGTKLLEDLVETGILCVQDARTWDIDKPRGDGPDRTKSCWSALVSQLFRRYRVEPQHWWGDQQQIPPAAVELADTPAFMTDAGFRSILSELQTQLDPSLRVIVTPDSTRNWHGPKGPDRHVARTAIRAGLPRLEELILGLKAILTNHRQKNVHQEQAASRSPNPLKLPSMKAIRVYFLYAGSGKSQAEVGRFYGQVYGEPLAQGQVSRFLKEVTAWNDAGNFLNLPELTHAERELAMDPVILDLGANQDRRTKGQRRKKNDDE